MRAAKARAKTYKVFCMYASSRRRARRPRDLLALPTGPSGSASAFIASAYTLNHISSTPYVNLASHAYCSLATPPPHLHCFTRTRVCVSPREIAHCSHCSRSRGAGTRGAGSRPRAVRPSSARRWWRRPANSARSKKQRTGMRCGHGHHSVRCRPMRRRWRHATEAGWR